MGAAALAVYHHATGQSGPVASLPVSLHTTMRVFRSIGYSILLLPFCLSAQGSGPVVTQFRPIADRIIGAALADSAAAWNTLARFTDFSGHRLSGSAGLERGIDWMLAEMKKDGLDNVHAEPVMVPHWVRGDERAELVAPRRM